MSGATETEIFELYKTFYDQVFGYCVYRLFRKDFAEDAAAQVFLLLVEKYPSLRQRDRTGIRNWLYGAASNVAAHFLRDAKHRRRISEELAQERPTCSEPPQHEKLDWPVLYAALSRLNEKDQEILTLRYFSGLDSGQIAEALEISHVNVRVRLSRAIRKLRKELGVAFGEA